MNYSTVMDIVTREPGAIVCARAIFMFGIAVLVMLGLWLLASNRRPLD